MKILFLHLSDMHIHSKKDVNLFHVRKIVETLNVVGEFQHAFIILSGDITYSGLKEQYIHAWHLIGSIIAELKTKFKISWVHILPVPGNHDVNLSKNDLGRKKIEELYELNKIYDVIGEELKKQEQFMVFANRSKCFADENKLLCKKVVDCDGFKIEVNLLNSAVFSTIEEDKGLHYFPSYLSEKIVEPTGADLVISVMHHAPDWFNDSDKNTLEKVLFLKSTLIFLGHEHNISTKVISYNNNPDVKVLAGGMLCNNGCWDKSGYFVSTFDTEDRRFDLYEFNWNSTEQFYPQKQILSNSLQYKPSIEKKIEVSQEFTKSFYEDERQQLVDDFTKYFVFPRLQREEDTERISEIDITTQEDFIKELEDKKRIIIAGVDNSGKTSLLKQFFKILTKSKVVVYCDVDSISNKKPDKIIKSVFEDIYGDNPNDYLKFKQIPKDNRVLIVDDIDRINPRQFGNFLDKIDEDFGYIIFGTRNIFELDVLERAKKALDIKSIFYRYRIMPFYSDKREELIKNIVNIVCSDDSDKEEMIKVLCDAVKKERSLFNLNPDFIIQYVKYYCKNIKEISQNDGEVFSKVFEANIVNAVMPYLKKMNVDKLFIVLDKVAYYIHSQKAYPIKFKEVENIINAYNEKYDSDVKTLEFIRITTISKILAQCGDEEEYKFCNKNYLAYFVAREINRKYQEGGGDKDLRDILNYSCFGINADILLFITYITDNPRILRFILSIAVELTKEWPEFSLNKINIPYLDNCNPQEINAPNEKDKDDAKKAEIERERKINDDKIDTIDIYDYKEDDADQLINQLFRALSLMTTLAKCLPNFEHMMEKEDKERFVEIIYKMPNKIFYLWANEVERERKAIIELIKELQSQDYSHKKELSTDDVIKILQWQSISLLLDLYNVAATNATKDNTKKFLNKFKYDEAYTYSLEHLMVYEKSNSISGFIYEAEKLYDETKNATVKTMIKRIVHHLLVHAKKISVGETQRIERKFFNSVAEQRRIMLLRAKNKIINE